MNDKQIDRILSLEVEDGLKEAGFLPMETAPGKWMLPMGEDFTLILWSKGASSVINWKQEVRMEIVSEHKFDALSGKNGWSLLCQEGTLFAMISRLIDAQEEKNSLQDKANRLEEEKIFSNFLCAQEPSDYPTYEYLYYALKRRLEKPEEGAFKIEANLGACQTLLIACEGIGYAVERFDRHLSIHEINSTEVFRLCSDKSSILKMEDDIGQWIQRDVTSRKNSEALKTLKTVKDAFFDLGYSTHENHFGTVEITRTTADAFFVLIEPPTEKGFEVWEMKSEGNPWKHVRYPRNISADLLAERIIEHLQNAERDHR